MLWREARNRKRKTGMGRTERKRKEMDAIETSRRRRNKNRPHPLVPMDSSSRPSSPFGSTTDINAKTPLPETRSRDSSPTSTEKKVTKPRP